MRILDSAFLNRYAPISVEIVGEFRSLFIIHTLYRSCIVKVSLVVDYIDYYKNAKKLTAEAIPIAHQIRPVTRS